MLQREILLLLIILKEFWMNIMVESMFVLQTLLIYKPMKNSCIISDNFNPNKISLHSQSNVKLTN